jgi:hypothetical protein
MTHVASHRKARRPPVDPIVLFARGEVTAEESVALRKKYWDEFDAIPLEDIGLGHDGETFVDDTLEEMLERVVMLRKAGYLVPDYVVKGIEEDCKG